MTEHVFFYDDPRFDAHTPPGPHPERPERLLAVRRGLVATLEEAGAEKAATRHASRDELLATHSEAYVDRLLATLHASGSGQLDADTYFSRGTEDAALRAAGSAAELGKRLAEQSGSIGVLAARPPGHHATATQSMGFCLINNVAVAAHAALAHGLSRVAILDWDVHHGNGTQAIFESDPRVLFASLHQWPLYPGTGKSEDCGRGEALGQSLNVPLAAGGASSDYARAMEQLIVPALEQFAPELVLVSCGFDAHEDDPLASMALRDEDYGALTTLVLDAGRRAGASRFGVVLEGGYDLGALERSSRAVALGLLGTKLELEAGAARASTQRAIDATRRAVSARFTL